MIKVKRADPSTHQYWADRGWDCALFWAVTGNHRTWVYRKLQVAGVCDSVRCELSKKGVGSERFTTTNCGDSVVVRYKGGHASQLPGTSACSNSLLCKTCLLEFASCLRGFCSNCFPAYSSKYCSIHRGMMCKACCGSQGQCKHGFCGNCCPAYSAKYCRMHYGPSCPGCMRPRILFLLLPSAFCPVLSPAPSCRLRYSKLQRATPAGQGGIRNLYEHSREVYDIFIAMFRPAVHGVPETMLGLAGSSS